ncbi:MAG: acyl-CoA synthetase [Candidatus Binatia bacterium]
MDLSSWIGRRAAATPAKLAIRFEGGEISYATLDERIRRLAAMLAHRCDVARGDRVAYLGLNGPVVLELLFACARLGAIFVPLNWRLAPPEHRDVLAHCAPKVLVAETEFLAHVDAIRSGLTGLLTVACDGPSHGGWPSYDELVAAAAGLDVPAGGDPSAPVLLVYTSGTTGRPKGALLTQDALSWNAINSIDAHEMTSDDHVLTVLPMFHVGGLNIHTTPALRAGASLTLHRRFDPRRALGAIANERPTMFLAVPQVSLAMTEHPQWMSTDVTCLRSVATGSSIVPEPVIRPWHERGIAVTQVYGLTESAPVAICLRRKDARRKLGSCGEPALHCEARIVDDEGRELGANEKGEIVLRGPNLFREYWNDAAATAESFTDGWFRTGDIGHRDEEGFFYVDDRKKDVLISGGENVYPAELEAVLAACPAILEAAVVGRPDERWGEVPIAFVVPRPGSELTPQAVLALFAGRLARFKHPRAVVFLERLPRNVMGKVLKQELRAPCPPR